MDHTGHTLVIQVRHESRMCHMGQPWVVQGSYMGHVGVNHASYMSDIGHVWVNYGSYWSCMGQTGHAWVMYGSTIDHVSMSHPWVMVIYKTDPGDSGPWE